MTAVLVACLCLGHLFPGQEACDPAGGAVVRDADQDREPRLRLTRVAICDFPPLPMIRSPSQKLGTARSSASLGR